MNGVLALGDGLIHGIRIEVKDAYGNSSSLSFRIRCTPAAIATTPAKAPGREPLSVSPAYLAMKKFYPGMIDGIETPDCAFFLSEKSLYDSVNIGTTVAAYPSASSERTTGPLPEGPSLAGRRRRATFGSSPEPPIRTAGPLPATGTSSLPGGVSAAFTIGAPWIPLLEPVMVRLRLTSPAVNPQSGGKPTQSTDKIVMVCFNGAERDVQRPEWQGAWASARFREFGNYQLVEDRTAPIITPLQPMDSAVPVRTGRIAFSVKDDLGAVRNFRAELDGGAWLCFSNDKGGAYIYKFDEHCPPGRHTLKVSVEDVAGNRTIEEYHFIR
jgi:hypothetical protein